MMGELLAAALGVCRQPILAAVLLIHGHDNLLPRYQLGHRLALFRHEFVNGRDNQAVTRHENRTCRSIEDFHV